VSAYVAEKAARAAHGWSSPRRPRAASRSSEIGHSSLSYPSCPSDR
jgi:hypothetical protein